MTIPTVTAGRHAISHDSTRYSRLGLLLVLLALRHGATQCSPPHKRKKKDNSIEGNGTQSHPPRPLNVRLPTTKKHQQISKQCCGRTSKVARCTLASHERPLWCHVDGGLLRVPPSMASHPRPHPCTSTLINCQTLIYSSDQSRSDNELFTLSSHQRH